MQLHVGSRIHRCPVFGPWGLSTGLIRYFFHRSVWLPDPSGLPGCRICERHDRARNPEWENEFFHKTEETKKYQDLEIPKPWQCIRMLAQGSIGSLRLTFGLGIGPNQHLLIVPCGSQIKDGKYFDQRGIGNLLFLGFQNG